jgi:hypothetical protein
MKEKVYETTYRFTKQELYEIEKAFDQLAGQVAHATGDFVSRMGTTKKAKPLVDKVIDGACSYYDMARTISAKASKFRGE